MSLGNDQRVEIADWKAIIEGYCFLIAVYPLIYMEVAKWAVGCLIHGLAFTLLVMMTMKLDCQIVQHGSRRRMCVSFTKFETKLPQS